MDVQFWKNVKPWLLDTALGFVTLALDSNESPGLIYKVQCIYER